MIDDDMRTTRNTYIHGASYSVLLFFFLSLSRRKGKRQALLSIYRKERWPAPATPPSSPRAGRVWRVAERQRKKAICCWVERWVRN